MAKRLSPRIIYSLTLSFNCLEPFRPVPPPKITPKHEDSPPLGDCISCKYPLRYDASTLMNSYVMPARLRMRAVVSNLNTRFGCAESVMPGGWGKIGEHLWQSQGRCRQQGLALFNELIPAPPTLIEDIYLTYPAGRITTFKFRTRGRSVCFQLPGELRF